MSVCYYFSTTDSHYEIQGDGCPLVLLHGGFTTIEGSFKQIRPALAKTRKTIAIEQQAHGHTADINRPLTQEQMADDTAALLRHLKIENADFFGFSMGGNISLQLALRHPKLARKIAFIGTNYNNDGMTPENFELLKKTTAESLPPQLREDYLKVAPHPEDWATLVSKVKKQAMEFKGFSPETLQSIQQPTLVMIGDNDFHSVEHEARLFRLLPHSRLAVLPGTNHDSVNQRPDWIVSMIQDFLDAPM